MNPDNLTLRNVGRDPERRPDARPATSFVEALRQALADGQPVMMAIRQAQKLFPKTAEQDLPPMVQQV